MENIVKALGEQIQAIGRSIQKQSELLFDALAPLKKLPELLQIQTKAVQESMSDNIRAQILVAIANQKGTLASKDIQIKEELQQVSRIEGKLKKTVDKIHQEKRGYLAKIAQETESSVDQLDAPVLNLTRRVFMSAIHLPMAEAIIPNMQLATGVGIGSSECRRLVFDKINQDVVNGLNFYRELVRDARQKAAELAHRDVELPEEFDVPLLAVEYEENGQVKRKIFAGPTVTPEGEISEQIPWFREHIVDEDALWRSALKPAAKGDSYTADQILNQFC